MTDAAETVVTNKVLTCNVTEFDNTMAPRRNKVFELLNSASSQSESMAAYMTYATMVNLETYQVWLCHREFA